MGSLPPRTVYRASSVSTNSQARKVRRELGVLEIYRLCGDIREIRGDLVEMAINEGLDLSFSSYLSTLPEEALNFVIESSSNNLPVRRCKGCVRGRMLTRALQSCLPDLVAERRSLHQTQSKLNKIETRPRYHTTKHSLHH